MKSFLSRKKILMFMNIFLVTSIFPTSISEIIGVKFDIKNVISIEESNLKAHGQQFSVSGQSSEAYLSVVGDSNFVSIWGERGTTSKNKKQIIWSDPSAYDKTVFVIKNKNVKNTSPRKILINYN